MKVEHSKTAYLSAFLLYYSTIPLIPLFLETFNSLANAPRNFTPKFCVERWKKYKGLNPKWNGISGMLCAPLMVYNLGIQSGGRYERI